MVSIMCLPCFHDNSFRVILHILSLGLYCIIGKLEVKAALFCRQTVISYFEAGDL